MLIAALRFMLCFLPLSLFADVFLGEALERQMWADMKSGNWENVAKHIAPGFQSVHPDGSRGRDQELALIKGLKLGNYRITDMKVTEEMDSLIVTYKIAVSETIDQEALDDEATPRMSVWQNYNATWQWICHANLNPIPKREKAQD